MNLNRLFLLAVFLMIAVGCKKNDTSSDQSRRPNNPVPIVVASVESRELDLEIRSVGNVAPIQEVTIRSQVTGVLTKIAFKEGDDVVKDQLLFEIDPRSFEADLKKAQAALEKDKAQLANAQQQAQRYKELVQKDFVTQSQYDEIITSVKMLQSAVKADEQAVENARLLLDRAFIRAPINGRTGSFNLHLGDIIKANDSALIQLNQIQPIMVEFSVPSEHLPDIQKYSQERELEVWVQLSKVRKDQLRGRLVFIDNAIDRSTGTILLKAEFSNEFEQLWPGQFVDTGLILTREKDVIVIPSEAIQTSQSGAFVYVVDSDTTVHKRDIDVRRTFNGLTVVEKGLVTGETVVTDGHLRLIDGSKVEIRSGLERTATETPEEPGE